MSASGAYRQKKTKLSHIDAKGEAHMVDIGGKADTERYAVAEAKVRISKELLQHLQENTLSKGDALATARIAGILAAKRTADIIPLCHTLPLAFVKVDLKLIEDPSGVDIKAEVRTCYKTGVEMEALMAVSAAALTIYDMGKSVDRGMIIESIQLVEKSGGQSGHWQRRDKK
ncbi:MAG: cyclic pyranopterin monophosphate synthase MoaC [Candidatus Zixiibacteriota bacterium]